MELIYGPTRIDRRRLRRAWKNSIWQANHPERMREVKNMSYHKTRLAERWRYLIYSAAARAKEKGWEFSLTMQWASERWTGKCEITGVPFVIVSGQRSLYAPSIDRIDGGKGYTEDNCRFVIWAFNALKDRHCDDDLRQIIKLIASSNWFNGT